MDVVLPLLFGCLGFALIATGTWGITKRGREFGWLIVVGLCLWGLATAAAIYYAGSYRIGSEGIYHIGSK